MKKQFKKQPQETQIIWKNQTHDAKFNPWKVYYAFVQADGKDHVIYYEGKFRTDAIAYFEEVTRLDGLQFNGKIFTLK